MVASVRSVSRVENSCAVCRSQSSLRVGWGIFATGHGPHHATKMNGIARDLCTIQSIQPSLHGRTHARAYFPWNVHTRTDTAHAAHTARERYRRRSRVAALARTLVD